LLFTVLFFWVLSAYGMGKKEIIFRPVTIRVFDYETNQPLEGISVKVVNVTFYPKRREFLGLTIEQTDIRTHRLYSYQTNLNGSVEIPQFAYTIGSNNYLHSQLIVVNMDVAGMSKKEIEKEEIFEAAGFYSEEGKLFYRPISTYKAALIESYPFPLNSGEFYQLDKTRAYLINIFNGHTVPVLTEQELRVEPTSFYCEHEAFDVYLERFIEVGGTRISGDADE
jgi:hypothetical protein